MGRVASLRGVALEDVEGAAELAGGFLEAAGLGSVLGAHFLGVRLALLHQLKLEVLARLLPGKYGDLRGVPVLDFPELVRRLGPAVEEPAAPSEGVPAALGERGPHRHDTQVLLVQALVLFLLCNVVHLLVRPALTRTLSLLDTWQEEFDFDLHWVPLHWSAVLGQREVVGLLVEFLGGAGEPLGDLLPGDLLAAGAVVPGREPLGAAADPEVGAAAAPLVALPAVPLDAPHHHSAYELLLGAASSGSLDAWVWQRRAESRIVLEFAAELLDVPEGLSLLYVDAAGHYLVVQVVLVDLVVQFPSRNET